jgi:Mlc titration factor MtfA (ptsG expression regulator)
MLFGSLKRYRRRKLRARPIPPEWRSILKHYFTAFQRLRPEDQRELLGHVQVFLAEKQFEGCGGLKLTDEIRLTIAAQACLLLLHRETDYYPQLSTILVYPSTYVAHGERHVEGPIWETGGQHLLGHTQHRLGTIVLAWDAVRHGAINPTDGRNVTLHEFAHQLDFEDYATNGAPVLATRDESREWVRIMTREFNALRVADETGTPTLLDTYGAANPAEFFAVVTEAFFERPLALRARHPELYAALQRFYCQDPARYFASTLQGAMVSEPPT